MTCTGGQADDAAGVDAAGVSPHLQQPRLQILLCMIQAVEQMHHMHCRAEVIIDVTSSIRGTARLKQLLSG
jgi:hypothetical protein